MVSKLMVIWGNGEKIIKVPFIVGAGTGCVYLEPFHKWSRDGSLSQLDQTEYIV